MIAPGGAIETIDRQACRARAVQRFSQTRMVDALRAALADVLAPADRSGSPPDRRGMSVTPRTRSTRPRSRWRRWSATSGIDCSEEDIGEDKLVLKHDRFFSIVTTHGDIAPAGRCSLGLFHDDTRILSGYALRWRGPAHLLSAEAPRTYAAQIDLAVKDLPFGGDPWDPKHAVHIRRELVLSDRLAERVTLTNYLAQPLEFWLELSLGLRLRRHLRSARLAPAPSGDSSSRPSRRTIGCCSATAAGTAA